MRLGLPGSSSKSCSSGLWHSMRWNFACCRVPDECPEEVADLISDCMATEPGARPSAEDVVRRLQVGPLLHTPALSRPISARCHETLTFSSAVNSLQTLARIQAAPAGPRLQRQGDSGGSLAMASGIAGDLQRQGDSAGGASVASSVMGTLYRQHDSSSAQSVASNPEFLPSLPSASARQAAFDVSLEQFLRLKMRSDSAAASHASASVVEMARLSAKSGLTTASSEGGPMLYLSSAAASCSSLSAAERYAPRSLSSALSVPSSAASFVTGALSSAVSTAGPPSSPPGALEAVTQAPGPPRLALQASSVVMPRVSDPASGGMRSARSMSSGAAAAQGWRGDGAAALSTGGHGECNPCVAEGQHGNSAHGGGPDVVSPQGCLPTTAMPPISPFVASRQTRQRRMLPVSPFSTQE